METLELQHYLIESILKVSDISILNEVKKVLEKKTVEKKYVLTELEKISIEKSLKEIDNQNFIEHEELFKELEAWLDEK